MKIPSKLTLLDPTNETTPATRPRAQRLDCISGKRIGLLDISKPLGNFFLDTVEDVLKKKGALVERFAKATFTKPAPLDLRYKIATSCDAVIEALAD